MTFRGGRCERRRRFASTIASTMPADTTTTPTPAIAPHAHTGNPAVGFASDRSPDTDPEPFASAVFVAEYFMQSEPPSARHCSTFFHAAC